MVTSPVAVDVDTDVERLYWASRRPRLVEVPELVFAMVDGVGPPAAEAFQQATQALRAIADVMRLTFTPELEWHAAHLEARWATAGLPADLATAARAGAFAPRDRDGWSWTLMMRVPADTDRRRLRALGEAARHRAPDAAIELVFLKRWREGLAAQVLHVGPYARELPTVAALSEYVRELGYEPRGRLHEIYLSDPRRCSPQRLRTILRQPVRVAR